MEAVSEKTVRYRQMIQDLLTRLAVIPNLEPDVQDHVIFDRQNDSYAEIAEGWDGEERIHQIVAHLEIINGKIWIQADNTDLVIAREMETSGVPRSDIVLGFRPASVRAESEYAAA